MQALSQLSYGPTAGKPASLGAVPGTVNHFFTFRTKPNAPRAMPIHFSTASVPFMIAAVGRQLDRPYVERWIEALSLEDEGRESKKTQL